jgi:hypothetical protein
MGWLKVVVVVVVVVAENLIEKFQCEKENGKRSVYTVKMKMLLFC